MLVFICRRESVKPGVKVKLFRTRRPALHLPQRKRRWRDRESAAMKKRRKRMERVRTRTHKHLRLAQPHRHAVTFKKINVHSNTVICCTLLTDCVMEAMKLNVNI